MKEKYLGKLNLEDKKINERLGKGKILTHISLFTGCGGLDLGFAKAGIQTRVMVEWDKSCCQTLRANFHWEELKKRGEGHYETEDGKIHKGPIYTGNKTKDGKKLKYVQDKLKWKNKKEFLQEAKDYEKELQRRKKSKKKRDDDYQFAMQSPPATWYQYPEPVIIEKDIKEVTTEEILKAGNLKIGECSIVSGGFPCQGFSLAGKRVIDDPRNALYKEFVRIVDEAKPVFIFGENVPGIVSMGKGEVMKQICEDFANCGYEITWDILNAADFGVPQHRKRVFLIGKRIDLMRFDEKGKPSLHIGAVSGEIKHPKLFYERLKRWKNKKLLAELSGQKTLT